MVEHMSDDNVRPRRALAPDDSADQPFDAEGLDDNPFARPSREPSTPPARARRSLPFDDADTSLDEPDEFLNEPDATLDEPSSMPSPVPGPVLPERGEGYFEGPGPLPRRSAMSSATPPEASEWVPESPSAVVEERVEPRESVPWYKAHLPAMIAAGVAVAVLAITAGFVGFNQTKPADPAPSTSATTTSSASPQVPRVMQDDLVSVADAKKVSANADWTITATTDSIEKHAARPACLSTEASDAERLDSLQRTLGTTQDNQLALLHQLDAFPTEANAGQVYKERAAALAKCDEVPTLLLSSTKVTGVGDEAMQISVVEESEPRKYHDLLLARSGNLVSILDVVSADGSVKPQHLVDAVQRSVTQLCKKAGTCDVAKATVEPASVPPVEPRGWLIPSDLPRIRAGAGLWTTQPPTELTSKGTGCENMTLASESGPTKRQQATYLITQDDSTPEQFGLDEFVFTFKDENEAANFATKLDEGIDKCKSRVMGTKTTSLKAPSDAKALLIERESEKGAVFYQVAISQKKNKVVYLMTTVTKDFRFSEENFAKVIERAGVRIGQSD